MSADDIQEDAPEESYPPPVTKTVRGSKGDVKGQLQRWYQRNRTKRNDYMKRYRAFQRSMPPVTE